MYMCQYNNDTIDKPVYKDRSKGDRRPGLDGQVVSLDGFRYMQTAWKVFKFSSLYGQVVFIGMWSI